MATAIRMVERDSYLKTMYYDKIPAVYMSGRAKYYLRMAAVPGEQVYFLPDRPIEGLKIRNLIELAFNYRGQVIRFSIRVAAFNVGIIVADKPECLYKDLGRLYTRVNLPENMRVRLKYSEEHYALDYPRISRYETVTRPEAGVSVDPLDLSGLMQKLFIWAKHVADDCRMFLFTDRKPSRLEEQVIAETGLVLYLPSSQIGLPKIFPYLVSGIVTQKLFMSCLRRAGYDPNRLEDAMGNYIKSKSKKGIHSEAWVPILFHEYVIGYIYAGTREGSVRILEYEAVETIRRYAKIIAYALKTHGYFETRRLPDKPVNGKIANISASGILFTSFDSAETSAMRPGALLKVRLETIDRVVTIEKTRVVRRSKRGSAVDVGCQFMDMTGGDREFLFECIYGKDREEHGLGFSDRLGITRGTG